MVKRPMTQEEKDAAAKAPNITFPEGSDFKINENKNMITLRDAEGRSHLMTPAEYKDTLREEGFARGHAATPVGESIEAARQRQTDKETTERVIRLKTQDLRSTIAAQNAIRQEMIAAGLGPPALQVPKIELPRPPITESFNDIIPMPEKAKEKSGISQFLNFLQGGTNFGKGEKLNVAGEPVAIGMPSFAGLTNMAADTGFTAGEALASGPATAGQLRYLNALNIPAEGITKMEATFLLTQAEGTTAGAGAMITAARTAMAGKIAKIIFGRSLQQGIIRGAIYGGGTFGVLKGLVASANSVRSHALSNMDAVIKDVANPDSGISYSNGYAQLKKQEQNILSAERSVNWIFRHKPLLWASMGQNELADFIFTREYSIPQKYVELGNAALNVQTQQNIQQEQEQKYWAQYGLAGPAQGG